MSEIDNLMNLSDAMSNEAFKPINEFIETVMGLEEANLTSDMVEMLSGMITGAFTPALKEQSVQSVLESYEDNGFTRAQAFASNQQMKDSFSELLGSLKPSEKKLELLNTVFRQLRLVVSAVNQIVGSDRQGGIQIFKQFFVNSVVVFRFGIVLVHDGDYRSAVHRTVSLFCF